MGAVKTTLLSRKTIKRNTAVGGDKEPAGSLDSHCGSLWEDWRMDRSLFSLLPGSIRSVGGGGAVSHMGGELSHGRGEAVSHIRPPMAGTVHGCLFSISTEIAGCARL